jgi:hypothetical protein
VLRLCAPLAAALTFVAAPAASAEAPPSTDYAGAPDLNDRTARPLECMRAAHPGSFRRTPAG